MASEPLRVAVAQVAPVLLDRAATLAKVAGVVAEAAAGGAGLVAFGESLVPGYPHWLSSTHGSRFESPEQKATHARYLREGVDVAAGDLAPVADACRAGEINVVLGVAERAADRGGHTLYCSLVYLDAAGEVRNVHRKLVPTYEERLAWGHGDGHGLRTFDVDGFTLGTLNCWENWMPTARAALHAQGEDLHVAAWPGSRRNTADLTPVLARELRGYVLSASGILRRDDLPADLPLREAMLAGEAGDFSDGGSCIAGPDGRWLVEPQVGGEGVWFADLDPTAVAAERQNFDPAGHYSRPDVLRLHVNRDRQATATFNDDL